MCSALLLLANPQKLSRNNRPRPTGPRQRSFRTSLASGNVAEAVVAVELHAVPRAQHLLLPNPLLERAELGLVLEAVAARHAGQQQAVVRVAERQPLEAVAAAAECS